MTGSNLCPICEGKRLVRVGWSPVNNTKIRIEYDACPECTPPPHNWYAKQEAERIKRELAK